MPLYSHPVLDCAAAAAFEAERLGGDEALEWAAMNRAGTGLARGIVAELAVAGITQATTGRLLVVIGKGHNGGDALIAAARLAEQALGWRIEVGLVWPPSALRPLAMRAWRDLMQGPARDRVRQVTRDQVAGPFLAVIDGVFGFQYRPPLREPATAWLRAINAVDAGVKAAVDLPSGSDEPDGFCADVTFATGIVKTPVLGLANAGRLRYVDIGFFGGNESGDSRVLAIAGVLEPLRRLRPGRSDKRTFGHLFVLGGSRLYPGAVAMSVAAALRSGVGLVSAFVPESLAPAFAARWPEAMWVGCPETADGGLAIDAGYLLRQRRERATALLIGPGLGREPETLAMVTSLVHESSVPVVLDADALQPNIVTAGNAPRVLTPHAGEFARIAGSPKEDPIAFEPGPSTVLVLKGPVTRIIHAKQSHFAPVGGPVLARGGSGDLLAGLIGGRLAANPVDPAGAAAEGVVWHGLAADRLARSAGETAVCTTDLIDHLAPVLREVGR